MTLVGIFPQGFDPGDQAALTRFLVDIPQSHWWSAASADYGIDAPAKVVVGSGPALDPSITTFDQLGDYAMSAANAGGVPLPDNKTLYMVFIPLGQHPIGVYAESGQHDQLNGTSNALAFAETLEGEDHATQLAQVETTASHEIFETASDAVPGNGYIMLFSDKKPWNHSVWESYPLGTELADLCYSAGPWVEGEFSFARIWSNSAAAAGTDPCVPVVGEDYFNTSAAQDWYGVKAGASVEIPVGAWSVQGTSSWQVRVGDAYGAAMPDDGTIETVQNGAQFSIRYTTPADAPSGTWQVMRLESQQVSGGPINTWPVGIYIL
jgi:hypothetical protein